MVNGRLLDGESLPRLSYYLKDTPQVKRAAGQSRMEAVRHFLVSGRHSGIAQRRFDIMTRGGS
jgi:hypothetical protein